MEWLQGSGTGDLVCWTSGDGWTFWMVDDSGENCVVRRRFIGS